MNRIPAGNKVLIFDGTVETGLCELVKAEGSYALFDGASPGQLAHETFIDVDGKSTEFGKFSYALAQVLLKAKPNETTYGEIADAVADAMKAELADQTPQFAGNRDRPMFAADEYFLDLFEFSLRKNFAPFARRALAQRYVRIQERMKVAFPRAHCAFGRAFFEKGSYREAINALQTAVTQGQKTGVHFTLGRAHFIAQDYAEALKSFQSLRTANDPQTPAPQVEQVVALLEKLDKEEKHALLVGIDSYESAKIPALTGASGDVRAVKKSLINKLGFKEKNIKVLLDQEASRKAILDEFKRLAAQEETALFYFAGYGSFKPLQRMPTILSADARQPDVEDITIKELSEMAAGRFNLLTIIDAGWHQTAKPSPDTRSMPTEKRRKKTAIPNLPVIESATGWETIGQVSIYPRSFAEQIPGRLTESLAKPAKRGRGANKKSQESFARALVEVLDMPDSAKLTYVDLVKEIAKKGNSGGPFIWGDHKDKRIFTNKLLHDRAQKLVIEIEREPVRQIIELLHRLIDKRKGYYAEGHLNLGLAYALVGEYSKSIESIGTALVQQVEDSADAHYHLGRVLFESGGDLADAVSELRKATELDPENARAYYYLGQAIRALVERETLLEAEKALRKYMEAGAPLGYGYEVQKFLDVRKAEQEESEKREGVTR
jgi:tetratricopeptide (TPR) repeat protein